MMELFIRRKTLYAKALLACFLLVVLMLVTWVGKENSAEIISLWRISADNTYTSVLYDQMERAEAISMADADVCENILHDDNSIQKILNKMLSKSLVFICGSIFLSILFSIMRRRWLWQGISKSETHEDILSCIYCISYL